VIQAYFAQIKATIDRYAVANFVLDTVVSFETRPGSQGYLHGFVMFVDGSRFFFREYLDVSANQVDKLMYAYHYQGVDDTLIFRYDNAQHKPKLPFLDHKHIADNEIVQAQGPTLHAVLTEIAERQNWI
jgi:hypothetical protein